MFDHAKKFDAEIKKQGAKTILYMTWAVQNKPEDQATISKAYLDLSSELKSQIAPVGNAWEAALKGDKKPALHTADKKHPTATGTLPGGVRDLCNDLRQEPRGPARQYRQAFG